MICWLFNRLPDDSIYYPAWILWLLVAGIKTWLYADFKTALKWYWNLDALRERPVEL